MNACAHSGRRNGGNGRDGDYCQSCIVESIESVFVHAADQPQGNIPLVAEPHTLAVSPAAATPASGYEAEDEDTATTQPASSSSVTSASDVISRPKASSPRLVPMNLRPAQQQQMLSSFLNTSFPTAKARADLADRRSYLAVLPDLDVSGTPLLRVAVDTLCFAHVGAQTGDLRLIHESQRSYGKVLASLIQATSHVAGAVPSVDPKMVITSIMLLCLYEHAIPLPYQGPTGWGTHYWGCHELLRAYGSSMLDMRLPFDRLLFWNLRMPLFFLGVGKRKHVVLGERSWLGLAEVSDKSRGPLTEFYRVAMTIPSLLEKCDETLQSASPDMGLGKLCSKIIKVREGILEWFDGRVRRSEGRLRHHPALIDTEHDRDAFDASTEEHCYMMTSRVFTHFFRFRDTGFAFDMHTLKTLCVLVLDCTLLRVLHFHPDAAEYIRPWLPTDVENSAYDTAADLCRSIHHYASYDIVAYTDWTEFLTEMALGYFEEAGKREELGWCSAVRIATQLRRQRLKTVHASTLCRINVVGPGFTTVTRYKAYDILAARGGD